MDGDIQDEAFEALLDHLKRNRGFDFVGYKRSSLKRRVDRRIASLSVGSYAEYIDFLEVHPDEFPQLFNTILINVTAFFRDPSAWEYVASEIVPKILASAGTAPVRIWSAGCATGEEAYTLAMMFGEALGVDECTRRVKIYATDVDEEALAEARQAVYGHKQIAAVPPELLDKYFDRTGNRFAFRKELRRSVIFGRHDLIQDAPISRIDFLVCRNTAMYFNAETQAKILARLRFALKESGFLFLGKAEMLLTHGHLFKPVDLKRRIFAKVPSVGFRDREVPRPLAEPEPDPSASDDMKLYEQAFESAALAAIVVDSTGSIVRANESARTLFGLRVSDLGRPLRDFELSYKPVELRSCIERASTTGRTETLKEIVWPRAPGEPGYYDVQVTPLIANGTPLGVQITFADVSQSKRLQSELRHTNSELEEAYEELQSTSEELETTNEELQSTVEELETTNEELQSTNEELETMNEELQSTNEELQTMNDELRQRSEELNNANAFLETILTTLRVGVIVLDQDMHVSVWNQKCEDLWGLRADEVMKKHLLSLDIGLPVDQLKAPVKSCLSGETDHVELAVEALNRRGKIVRCAVSCSKLVTTSGVILLIDDKPTPQADQAEKPHEQRSGEVS